MKVEIDTPSNSYWIIKAYPFGVWCGSSFKTLCSELSELLSKVVFG